MTVKFQVGKLVALSATGKLGRVNKSLLEQTKNYSQARVKSVASAKLTARIVEGRLSNGMVLLMACL